MTDFQICDITPCSIVAFILHSLFLFEELTILPHQESSSRSSTFKGTNGRQKTYEISHVYSIFYSGFMCQTTVIFEITKDGSLY